MKIVVSILILAALASGQHLAPVKRAILGKGFGKIEVESIDKSVEVGPNLGTQNALYLSPPIKDLPIQDSSIQQPSINYLKPPYPPKETEKPFHAEPLQHPITSRGQTYESQDQRYSRFNNLAPTQINGLGATSASGYNAEGYLPPDGNHHQITHTQEKQIPNQPFQAPMVPLVENQPTYKDYIAKLQTPESHEEYYKAPGYLPPTNNQQSLKLDLVSNSPFLKNLQQQNALGYLPPTENKVVFPQSGTYEAPGNLPPSSRSSGQTTTRLVPVKDSFQISQQGYTEAFITRKLPHNHEYAASDYLPPSNQPLTTHNSNLEAQPNIYGAQSPIHPPKPNQLHPSPIQTHSPPEYLPPQNNRPLKNQADEYYSAPGYLPPHGNDHVDKPAQNGLSHHETNSASGYLPPNQQGDSDPTDIDVRIGNDPSIQSGINDHNGYDYSKPQGPAFHEGQSQNNVQTLIDESHNSYHTTEKSQKSANHVSLENQIQTIKIIRENANGQQESVRTIQIIAENDQSNAIRTIKILKDSQPVDNAKTIKLIDYSSPSNNGYLPPQSTISTNYSPNMHSSQQVYSQNIKNLAPLTSSVQAPSPSSNNGYLPPDSINNYGSNNFSPQQAHDQNTKNLAPPSNSIQAPLIIPSSSSNNGYLPPEPITTNDHSSHNLSFQPEHDATIHNLPPPSTSIQAPLAFPSSSSNNGYLPPPPAAVNNVHFAQQNFPSASHPSLQFNSQPIRTTPIQAPSQISHPFSPPHSNHQSNNYLPPPSSAPQFDLIRIISENNYNGEDPAIYASVAAANLNNVKTIQIVNGRNNVETRPYGEVAKGYTKTRLLRFYRRF